MAIVLKEGEYALQQNNAKKIVLQFKLTDSALRAIEEYQDRGGRNGKPTIQFDGKQGSIQIPGLGDGEGQNFTFQFASLSQSVAIDCLQQSRTREAMGRISVLGAIQHKITVNANDDSYNATRKRMTLVKEQEQKTSTKVIKQPSSSKLGKNKTVRRVLDQANRSLPFSHGRTATPPPSRHSTTLPYNRSLSPLTSASAHRSESPISSSGDLAGVRNKTKPVLSSLTSSTTSNQQSTNSSGKPLDETVTHLLAPRPLKHQELVIRLNRFGAAPDKTKLQSILQQVSTSRTVGKGEVEYALNKAAYGEVRPDWSGFTDDERSVVRRKLAEIKIAAADSRKRPLPVADAQKPKPEYPGSSPKTRQAEDEANYTNPVRKKPRVSYYSKTSPNAGSGGRPRSVSPLETGGMISLHPTSVPTISSSSIVKLDDTEATGFGAAADGPSPRKQRGDHRRSPLVTPPLENANPEVDSKAGKVENGEVSPLRPTEQRSSKSRSRKEDSSSQPKQAEYSESSEERSLPALSQSRQDAREDDKDEFVHKYQVINYSEQRTQYKKDFHAEYKEYLRLHEKVADQAKRFAEWQKQISKEETGTDQYKIIGRKVLEEYKKLKKDHTFRKDIERFEYLHRKLKHIKDLVLDYDRREAKRRL